MNPNLNEDSESLIHNPDFFEWVVRPNKELDQYWEKFISEHPLRKKEVDEAIFIIKSILPKEKELTEEMVLHLWNRIENKTIGHQKVIFHFPRWWAAATFLLLTGISGLIYFQVSQTNAPHFNYQSIAKVETPDNDIKLIFADKSEEVLSSNDLDITYSNKGEIVVNSDQRLAHKFQENKSEAEQLNQLVVPRGKRTSLTLSDGTKLWLNSGSRAIFPVLFTKNEREIFIEGEAYLEVAHNESKPFFVITNNIQIRVLGTTFNVAAYPDELATTVVLVEGSVQAIVDSKKMVIKPNQLLTYEKNSGKTALNETDVMRYVSWKDGWMYCEREKLETIAAKLSRYYDVKIEFADAKAKEMTITGKLDLKTECTEIFNAISSTAPISFETQDNTILIHSKSAN